MMSFQMLLEFVICKSCWKCNHTRQRRTQIQSVFYVETGLCAAGVFCLRETLEPETSSERM